MRPPRPFECALLLAAALASSVTAEAGEIRGRLLLGDRPAAGVTVSAIPYEPPEIEARRLGRGGEAPRAIAAVTTRADGTFAVVVPPRSGTFHLLAEGGGAVASWLGGTYDSSESDDLGEHALLRADTLAGRVVSATGAPIAGAAVTVRPRAATGGDPDVTPLARTVITGADGVFRSSDAALDGNRITVAAKSYGTVALANVRAGAMPRPVALGLGALVSGMVLNSDRKTPAAGVLVRYEADGLETAWTEAGADGRFALAEVPARAGTIVAEGGEAGLGAVSTGPLPAAPGRVITVVLAPAPTLEGRVLDTKTRAPVPRVRLTVEDGTRTRTARSGPDGRYQVRGLLPQRPYRLRADDPRYTAYVRDRVLLATAETVQLDVPLSLAASLSGRVVDEGGKPVAGALGRIIPATAGGGLAGWRRVRGSGDLVFRTAADGTFNATRLAAGADQRLIVAHPDFEPKTMGGLALAPGSSKTVNVVLRRGLALAGRVRDESGRPVGDADVEVAGGSTLGALGARVLGGAALAAARPKTTSGADGRFEVKGLSEGTYSLAISKPGYADHRLDRVPIHTGRRDPLEITLSTGASIRGAIARRDGRGAEGYWVRALAPGSLGPGFGPFGFGDVRPTGPDGGFSIDGLRAGDTYDLVVLGPDGVGTRREGVAAPAEGVDIVVSGPGRIAGRVVDAQTLSPVADFQVDFGPDRSSSRAGGGPGAGRAMARAIRIAAAGTAGGPQAVHSEEGHFVLEDVPAGTWEVVAQARGYQSARVGGLSVEEGSTRDAGEVRLTPGHAIRGRVIDGATGAPVLDASVALQRAGGGRALAVLMGESDARTDGEGRFAIEGLAAGSYGVIAQHPDYASATTAVDVKDGPATVELRMGTGGTLAGTVLSETSAPLPGAAVSLSTGGGGRGPGGARAGFGGGPTTVTDDAGRFRFLHVAPGRYEVAAALRGRRTIPADVILPAGESREGLVLSLASGARIRGSVTGLPATLRGNVRVTASGADGYSAATIASADGVFEVTGAPVGPVDLRAISIADGTGTMRSATAQIAIAEGQDDVTAQIVFEAGSSLSGTVTRNGQPVEGAMVTVSFNSARTSASGAYRIEGLSDGTSNVMVMPAVGFGAGSTPRTQQVTIAGDTTLDLVIPSARIGGVVLDGATRQPLGDAFVQAGVREAANQPAGGRSGSRGPRSLTTDSNGRFAFEDLDPSPYTITVRKAGYQLETREATPSETAGDDLVFELTPGAGIAIQVRDASFGVPLRTVQVRASAGAGPVFAGAVPLDGEGRGEVPSLPPGGYGLAVYASGYAPALLTVTTPAPPLVVPLTVGGGIEIHAGPATLVKGSARVQVLTAGGQPYPFSFFSSEGRLTLSAPIRRVENLAPGSYVLQVEGGEGRPFEVQPGALTIVTLP